jgi:hypothetical protein
LTRRKSHGRRLFVGVRLKVGTERGHLGQKPPLSDAYAGAGANTHARYASDKDDKCPKCPGWREWQAWGRKMGQAITPQGSRMSLVGDDLEHIGAVPGRLLASAA